MRGVIGFLVWLFSFWTWRAFFLGWFKTPPLDQAGLENANAGVEHLRSSEGEGESALATFLSSLPKDTGVLSYYFGEDVFELLTLTDERREFLGDAATNREFLAAVASSKVGCTERLYSRSGWEDSVRHFEEIVEALLSNRNFKSVFLVSRDWPSVRVAECVSNLLLGNNVIQHIFVSLYGEEMTVGKEGAEQLANALHKNRALKTLELWGLPIDDEGMEVLMKPLMDTDSVLEALDVTVFDVGFEHLSLMLGTNTSLESVCVRKPTQIGDAVNMRGFSSLKDALCSNRTLEHLSCTVTCSMELKLLLEPLMPMSNNPQANTTLTSLFLSQARIGGKEGVDILVDMLCSNKSLLDLTFRRMEEFGINDSDAIEHIVTILNALKNNKSLKKISFEDCQAIGGYKILGTMMDLLLENHHLEDIDLEGTPLENSGDAEYVYSALEKRKKMKLWELVKDMGSESPNSGRVFLCGHPYAGKTTLRMSIKRLTEYQNAKRLRFRDKFRTHKGQKVSKMEVPIERTRGIEIDNLPYDGIGISIWDMAGQTDYHSFHDLVVPNLSADGSCSLFLLACNPMEGNSAQKRDISSIKSEIEYWLRFIASNTRRSLLYRAHVSMVMTHFDYWDKENEFASRIADVVEELKSQFQEVLDFDVDRMFFKINGQDESYAQEVFDFMQSYLKQLLRRLPKTIKACAEVQRLVVEWNTQLSKQHQDVQSSKQPMLQWKEFCDNMCKGVEELNDEDEELSQRKKEFVAISLNDGGHIMYHEEGGFVITNPHWFCHDIMGEFLYYCSKVDCGLEMISEYGTIPIARVKRILLDHTMKGQGCEKFLDDILSMMKKLYFCYEQDANTIMIPSTLKAKDQILSWNVDHGSTNLAYVGRRLTCKDVMRTMLSLGFFSRLQVSFFNKFKSTNVSVTYELFQDVIKFIHDGIEVIIEFNHVDIDIFLRSKQCVDQMLGFLENVIGRHIKDLLLNPTLGCPGVILEEHIFRPECVQELVNSKDCKNQFVRMEDLEMEVMTMGVSATHNWKQCGHLKTSFTDVKTLLGNIAWQRLLERRFKELQRYHRQILATCQNDSLISEEDGSQLSTNSIWHGLWRFFTPASNLSKVQLEETLIAKVDNIEKMIGRNHVEVMAKLDDVIRIEEKIMKMQDNLFREVCSRIDDVMAFSIRMQQAQVPKLAYLTETGKRHLLTRFVPGLMTFQLHLMCENRDKIHEVVDQEGCEVKFGTKDTRTFVTMLVWGLKLATVLTKIGAHVAAGMGGMIPDFSEGVSFTALILDTSGLLDQQIPRVTLESLPDDVKRRPSITIDDIPRAEEWLIEFLERKCNEKSRFVNEMFKLKKVVYKATNGKASIAWICEKCESDGIRSGIL